MCVCVCIFFSLFFFFFFLPQSSRERHPCPRFGLSWSQRKSYSKSSPHPLRPPLPAPLPHTVPVLLCCHVSCPAAATPAGYDEVHHPATMLAYIPVYMFSCGPGGHTSWLRRSTPPSNDACLHSCAHAFPVVPATTPAGYDEVHHPATMLAYIPVYMPFVWSRRPYQMTTTKYTTQERCLPTFLCTCFLCGPGGHTN